MDKGVSGDDGLKTSLECTERIVIVFVATHSKTLVQEPDLVDDPTRDEQTKANKPVGALACSVVLLAQQPCNRVEVGPRLVVDHNLLHPADLIGAWTDKSDGRIAADARIILLSQPVVTMVSLFKRRICIPEASRIPWFAAAGNPWFSEFWMTRTSPLSFKYSTVPSVEALSTTMISYGSSVKRLMLSKHSRVKLSWLWVAMTIEVRPASSSWAGDASIRYS